MVIEKRPRPIRERLDVVIDKLPLEYTNRVSLWVLRQFQPVFDVRSERQGLGHRHKARSDFEASVGLSRVDAPFLRLGIWF